MDAPPFASYAVTVVVVPMLVAALTLSFLLQVFLSTLMSPMLCFQSGRQYFHHLQSFVWRGTNGFVGVALNPFWRLDIHYVGDDPGPPRGGKGSIIFMNHRSTTDAWFSAWLLTRCCIEARYVYKSSLKKVPIYGWCLQLAGDLAVEFGDKDRIEDMMDRSARLLDAGYNIVVFPEGTRSPSGILQRFKPGFFKLACRTGCPTVPVIMSGTEKAWSLGAYRMGATRVKAAVGSPVYPGVGAAWDSLAQDIEDNMLNMAQELAEDSVISDSDPLITREPYRWWTPPTFLQGLAWEELLDTLRSGRGHQQHVGLL